MWRTWGHQREPSCPGEEVMSADDRYFSTMLDHWLTVNDGVLFGYFVLMLFRYHIQMYNKITFEMLLPT
jgi:hypothetical protein